MNTIVADSIARDRSRYLLAEASDARRARLARGRRRAAKHVEGRAAEGRPSVPGVIAGLVVRPYTAFHSWLAAGML